MSQAQDVAELKRAVRRALRREGLLAAVFQQTATSRFDKLTVTVPGFDGGEHTHGEPDGVVWWPGVDDDGEAVFPAAGDVAYVMEASDGRWVALSWVPAA